MGATLFAGMLFRRYGGWYGGDKAMRAPAHPENKKAA
jgi:hypothetical protein